MKQDFSKSWNSSSQPRKQRKYRYNAPLNTKRKFISVNLSKELRKKYGVRSLKPRTGDKVLVMRGSHKKKTGTIEKIDLKNTALFITKIEQSKRDGSKSKIPIHPSNVQLTELSLNDKNRKNKLTKLQEKPAAKKSQ